jgi:hypothetical protein
MRHRLRNVIFFALVFAFITTTMVRCLNRPLTTVPQDTAFVLYALDGDTYPVASPNWQDSGFHGWAILKQCSITHSEGVELLDALLADAASASSSVVDCFNPRHGLRVEYSSGTVDYLICFECFRFESWTDGREASATGSITQGPESLFSATLKNCRSEENVES